MGNERIPQLTDGKDYLTWKKEVQIWKLGTTAKDTQQAPRLVGFMEGKAHEAALQISADELGSSDGVKKLLAGLDLVFLKDKTQSLFQAIECFEQYSRSPSESIDDYIREFEQRYKKLTQLRDNKEAYEDGIKAFKLLHQANLKPEQKRLIRATTAELTYKGMTQALKRTFGDGSGILNTDIAMDACSAGPSSSKIKLEPVTLYTRGQSSSGDTDQSGYCSSATSERSRVLTSSASPSESDDEENVMYINGGKYRKINRQRPAYPERKFNQDRVNKFQKPKYQPEQKRTFSKAKGQERRSCLICDSPEHFVVNCPFNTYKRKRDDDKGLTFLTKIDHLESEVALPERDERYSFFIGETVNKGLLDTGASSTVCGRTWLNVFVESLPPCEASKIKTEPCEVAFRFGDGNKVIAKELVTIPVWMFGKSLLIKTHVVESKIPLLLSRQTMKELGCVIDISQNKVSAMGGEEPILDTQSGHLVVSIGRDENSPINSEETAYLVDVNDAKKTARHLHRYFAHGSTKKIGEWIKTTNIPNTAELLKELEDCAKTCDFCLKHKSKETPHRKVAIPSGNVFNDVIAVDLKKLDIGIWIVHYIDTVTRFTVAAPLMTKEGEEILTKTFRNWISIFGRPNLIISDNGGEFVNQQFLEMCSLCSIEFKTSPASSPWCNGMVERHHSLLSGMINAILEEQKCNIDIAIAWACNAKNSLNNVFGFSPYQLVFGKNPTVPSILEYQNLPSLNSHTSSQIVAENLQAMHTARKKFIEMENSEKLKRVLRERVYESNNAHYTTGDLVYYKKDSTFLGPGYVVGQIANSVLIKHGGALIRVNPCKVVLKSKADDMVNGNQPNPDTTSCEEPEAHHQSKTSGNEDLVKDQRAHTKAKTRVSDGSECSSDSEEEPPEEPSEEPSEEPPEELSTENRVQDTVQDSSEEPTPSQADHQTWNRVEPSGKNQALALKSNEVIRYRRSESEEWTNGLVDSRAGKATGSKKNCYNLQLDGNEEAEAVDLNNQEVERLLFVEEEHQVYNVGSAFLKHDPAVKAAKACEIKKFQEFGVYEEVKDIGQSTVSSRWVMTKTGDKVKARLVARGFEETYPRSDAPTIKKTSLRMFFTIATSKNWTLESLDITAAFLQADEMNREVFLKPPADIRKSGLIWRLKKPVYGLGDSARRWYITLKQHLQDKGCIVSKLDKCVFRFVENGKLQGLVATHVDDLLYCGTEKFKRQIIADVRKNFKISRMHAEMFTYLGWNVNQKPDCIYIDQRSYGESVQPIEISPKRKRECDSRLSDEEKTEYQRQLGKLLWLSGQTRPDLNFDTLELSTYASNACVKHVKVLNKVVKKIPGGPQHICFKRMDLDKDKIQIIFFSDASVGNLFDESGFRTDSGRGYLVFISNGKTANLVDWSSRKVKRKVHSAFGAETLACSDGLGAAISVRQILSETLYGDPRLRVIPIFGYIDSKQLHDHIASTKQCEEKRLQIDVSEIQECVETGEIDEINWIPTGQMLADCLTKKNVNCDQLIQVLQSGEF